MVMQTFGDLVNAIAELSQEYGAILERRTFGGNYGYTTPTADEIDALRQRAAQVMTTITAAEQAARTALPEEQANPDREYPTVGDRPSRQLQVLEVDGPRIQRMIATIDGWQ